MYLRLTRSTRDYNPYPANMLFAGEKVLIVAIGLDFEFTASGTLPPYCVTISKRGNSVQQLNKL